MQYFLDNLDRIARVVRIIKLNKYNIAKIIFHENWVLKSYNFIFRIMFQLIKIFYTAVKLQKEFQSLLFRLTIFHFCLWMLVDRDPKGKNGTNVLTLSRQYFFLCLLLNLIKFYWKIGKKSLDHQFRFCKYKFLMILIHKSKETSIFFYYFFYFLEASICSI